MAKLFRPGFWYDKKWVEFATYTELKRNLKAYLEDSKESHISVFRSRRGEWGEWFEHWVLDNGKPKIIKNGWQ